MVTETRLEVPAHVQRLICVAGSPRSGTTWIGKTFDSHPGTLYRHEPDSTHRPANLPLQILERDYDTYARAALEYVQRMLAERDAKTSGILPVFPKSYYGALGNRARRYSVVMVKALSRTGLEWRIPDFVSHRDVATVRLVWKTIESLGRVGILARLLPAARFVHVVRHPCGHIASTLRGEARHKFTSDNVAAEDFGIFELLLGTESLRNRGIDMGDIEAMTPVERLAVRWVAMNEQPMLQTTAAANVLSVAYEAICEDPLTEYAALFDFCGLDFASGTAAFLRDSTSHDDSSYYSIRKDPAKAANKWRDELEPAQADLIRAIVADSLPWELFAGRE